MYKLNKVLEGKQLKKKKPDMRRCPVPGAGVEGGGQKEGIGEDRMSHVSRQVGP